MKKITAVVLCIVLAFSLIGCGSKAAESTKEESSISTGGSFSKGSPKTEDAVTEPEETVTEPEETVTEPEETVIETAPIEGNPLSLIAGEYHLTAMVQDNTDYYELLKDYIATGDFDEWVIVTEEGNLTMYSLSRLGEDEKDAEPQSLGEYHITYDPDTNEVVVTDFSATDETIFCDGTILILDSPTYHMEFTKR